MVHEFQHIIHYTRVPYSMRVKWFNECMSAAAEELCYPGSCIVRRLTQWTGCPDDKRNDPPAEYLYDSSNQVHSGSTLFAFDNSQPHYEQVALFAQYLYSQFGDSVYFAIIEQPAKYKTPQEAIEIATGMSASDFIGRFRVAVAANAESGTYSHRHAHTDSELNSRVGHGVLCAHRHYRSG